MPRLRLGDWVDSGVNWLVAHMSWLFDAIRDTFTAFEIPASFDAFVDQVEAAEVRA